MISDDIRIVSVNEVYGELMDVAYIQIEKNGNYDIVPRNATTGVFSARLLSEERKIDFSNPAQWTLATQGQLVQRARKTG